MLVTSRTLRGAGLLATVLSIPLLPSPARADNSKKACVDASTDGQTLRKEDKLLEARDKLRVCATDPCPSVVKTHCTKWLSELEAQIPSAIVRAKDAAGNDVLDAIVTIDGNASALGRPETLDPGEHLVSVRRGSEPPSRRSSCSSTATRGGSSAWSFRPRGRRRRRGLRRAGNPRRRRRTPSRWEPGSSAASASSALGTFVGFAVNTSSDLSNLKKTCAPNCSDAATSSGRTSAKIADVALGVGIVAAGGAVIWALVGRHGDDEKPAQTGATIDVQPTTHGAVGTLGVRF